ncbi:MAG TPA: PilN domain-containing protein [Candidatus Methylomirabilis sp.]|nr:PilN domain-containing protein [Candidatus Methylomirabilis sp.]
MRVRLNLATRPLVTHRKFLAASSVLGLAAALVFAGLGWHVYLARKANAEMRAKSALILRQVTELERQRESLERFFAIDENKRLGDRAAFINNLIDARSFNWTLMFMDLEKLLPPGVRVISIEPKQDHGRVEVKISVGAASSENNLKFLKALQGSKSFSDVQLLEIRAPAQGSTNDQIVAELSAEYSRT